MFKEKLMAVVETLKANKPLVIQIGSILVGAVAGAVVAAVVNAAQEESLFEEVAMELLEESEIDEA